MRTTYSKSKRGAGAKDSPKAPPLLKTPISTPMSGKPKQQLAEQVLETEIAKNKQPVKTSERNVETIKESKGKEVHDDYYSDEELEQSVDTGKSRRQEINVDFDNYADDITYDDDYGSLMQQNPLIF